MPYRSLLKNLLILSILATTFATKSVFADSRDIVIRSAQQFNQEPKVALVVGISQYDRYSNLSRLKYAHRDAQVLQRGLQQQGFRVTPMINGQAGKQKILNRITELGKSFAKGQREGTFIFTFAGHGFGVGSGTYLATADADASNNATLRRSGLRLMDVVQALKRTGARRIILIIDACRNNPFAGARGGSGGRFARINPGEGVKILLSTRQADRSYEDPRLKQGVFSYFVSRAFQQAKDKNGVVTFDALAKYVEREVPIWSSQNLPITQQPYHQGVGETYGDFVIVSPKRFSQNSSRQQVRRSSAPAISRPPQRTRVTVKRKVAHYHANKAHTHILPQGRFNHQHGNGAVASKQPTRIIVRRQPQAPQAPKRTQAPRRTSANARRIGQYIDHGNGTVTDTKTGLMWKKCHEGQVGDNCTGKAKTYTWHDAMKQFNQVSFAGYKDWRMPTIKELRTLVYCSNGIPQQEAWDNFCTGKNNRGGNFQIPTINQEAFPNVRRFSVVWSSSSYANNNGSAWHVGFQGGYHGTHSKNGDGNQVRLVRSGQ